MKSDKEEIERRHQMIGWVKCKVAEDHFDDIADTILTLQDVLCRRNEEIRNVLNTIRTDDKVLGDKSGPIRRQLIAYIEDKLNLNEGGNHENRMS